MKVLMINGSPHENGNTTQVLAYMRSIFEANDVEVKEVRVGNDVKGCQACGQCGKLKKCVFDDIVNETAKEWEASDAILIGSPVYFSGMTGSLKAFMDRLFYCTRFERRGKVAGAIVAVRRAGGTATLDQINHYLLYNGMALASSSYWPIAYGCLPGEVSQDTEGWETAENLANNMIFMMKSFALGKEKYGFPEVKKPKARMNFIR